MTIACPVCNETGCEHCHDTGYIDVTGCPQEQVCEAAALVQLSDLFEKGLPPIAGGALDQSESFLTSSHCFQQDVIRINNEAAKR